MLLAGCGVTAGVAERALHPAFEAEMLQGSVPTSTPTRLYVGYAVSNVGQARGSASCSVVVAGWVRGRFHTRNLAAGSTWYQVQVVSIPAQVGEQVIHSESTHWDSSNFAPAVSVRCAVPEQARSTT
jgi:hypothetical protein